MKDFQQILEPQQSTINKLLLFSKSISAVKSHVLKDKILVHIN